MSIHIQSVDMDVCNVVVNGRFESQVEVDGIVQNKPKNILISSLGVNKYHSVSYCMTAKAMWDALETLHESTKDVKQ
ncbi:hypothetical protein MTR_2g037810 [Medicago truncatula]|uniref:Uncharacterized protein n=1 Tax=Medicago truncatula TaxID=3880 RepID=G7INK8_MEDTR|nr:hypothetical protein MTR_2g037810 [Medicago truncatula]